MVRITEVVKNLIIVNVIIFFTITLTPIGDILPSFNLYSPLLKDYFKPYQLVTHMFMHGSQGHLFMNMLALFFLGPYVEQYTGSKKFLILYLLCGLGATLTSIGVDYYQFYFNDVREFGSVVGASGAIMGVVMAFVVLFPNVKLMLIFPPIPIKAKYLGIAYILFDLFAGVGGAQTGIAHFAHLGGAFTGLALTYFWIKKSRWQR